MKVIAYGSLMNRRSLESVVRRPAPLSKVTVSGWRRIFNAPFDGYAFLNLQPAEGRRVEAAYFELDPAEQQLFDEREAGADLVEVARGFHAFVWPEDYCRELPALQSYVDFCSCAADELGVNFTAGLDWPKIIIDDTGNPLYRLGRRARKFHRNLPRPMSALLGGGGGRVVRETAMSARTSTRPSIRIAQRRAIFTRNWPR